MSSTNVKQLEILLVEDNNDDADWTVEALEEENVHCKVTRVEDGEEAMAFLKKEGKYASASQPAPILLELTLPKKGGLEVLKELREGNDARLKNVPVIIMTISTNFGDAQEALNLGVTSYLNKPVKLPEFIASVKKIIPDPALPLAERELLEAWAREMDRMA